MGSVGRIGTVLVANRGEIAVRIIRTCRELGLGTVAVYSSEDRGSPVLELADRAVQIGPGPARHSYLDMAAIVEAARMTGADAVHPGYGFLSEDPDFAAVCAAAGLLFIGPDSSVLARLGDKASARALMAEVGVPLLPGSTRPVENAGAAATVAAGIGYPVIVKATAGGGGRGMAVARSAAELGRVYRETRAAAQLLFGDSRVYVERYVEQARHVEVQLLGDSDGTVVHLGARDCSVQRRRQKLIEETPPPGLPAGVAAAMTEAAIRGLRACGYVGAATAEFVVDPSGDFYFLEVNCRIQVEHPVTEMCTGVDLVREQLRVAAGLPLQATGPEAAARGVSVECRVNAEDPDAGFRPTPGVLTGFEAPGGPFVRVDTHARPGLRISPMYDPLLAKVVVWAPDRDRALDRMDRALAELRVVGPGVRTTVGFLRQVLADPRFRRGEHTTSLVADLLPDSPD